MDKLKLAHDCALAYIKYGDGKTHYKDVVEFAWQYADAMQAETEKREDKTRPEALREVDWGAAPEWAKYHEDGCNGYIWVCENFEKIEEAPTFGFTGSHIVERPHGF